MRILAHQCLETVKGPIFFLQLNEKTKQMRVRVRLFHVSTTPISFQAGLAYRFTAEHWELAVFHQHKSFCGAGFEHIFLSSTGHHRSPPVHRSRLRSPKREPPGEHKQIPCAHRNVVPSLSLVVSDGWMVSGKGKCIILHALNSLSLNFMQNVGPKYDLSFVPYA